MPPQEQAVRDVSEAFATGATGLTPEQQTAFEEVQTAFDTPTTVQPPQQVGVAPTSIITTALAEDRFQADQVTLQPFQAEQEVRREEAVRAEDIPRPEPPEREKTEAVFVDPETQQEFTFGDPQINQPQIEERGLIFKSGVLPQFLRDRPALEAEVARTKEEADARARDEEIRVAKIQLDQSAAGLSAANRAVIEGIKETFERRRVQQTDINRRSQEGLRILGIRAGRQRFAPEVQVGILSAAESAGLAKIADLDAQEAGLVAEAERAAAIQDFALLSEKIDRLEETRDAKIEAFEEQRKMAKEQEDEATENFRRVSRENAIVNLVNQGINDPSQILDFINFDATGRQVGDITLEEINSTLSAIQEGGTEVLSVADAQRLGIPFGTTQAQASAMGIIPEGKPADLYDIRSVGNQVIRIRKDGSEPASVIFQGPTGEDPFTTQQRYSNTFAFSKEVVDNSKDFIIQRDAVNRIESALGQNSAAGDLAAIFAFMKAQDPNSVVRESEFATAAAARAELDRVDGIGFPVPSIALIAIKRLNTGERLTDSQQKDFLNTANSIFASALESQVITQADARTRAELLGIDPDLAVPDQTQTKKKLQIQLQPGEIIIWSLPDRTFFAITEDEFNPTTDLIY